MSKWIKGRQKGLEYYKLVLWQFVIGKWGFDAYILHYPKPCELPAHKDPVDGSHYRMNLTLKGKSEFICEKELVNWEFLHIFRPSLYTHSLKVLTETYKLSLGFAKLN